MGEEKKQRKSKIVSIPIPSGPPEWYPQPAFAVLRVLRDRFEDSQTHILELLNEIDAALDAKEEPLNPQFMESAAKDVEAFTADQERCMDLLQVLLKAIRKK
jgi:hypothetical protein